MRGFIHIKKNSYFKHEIIYYKYYVAKEWIYMQDVKNDIVNEALEFIKRYNFCISMDEVLMGGVDKVRICYKLDYFDENNEYYKKGIGDIILQFHSGYTIVIKENVSGNWCFALLGSSNFIIEEVWRLSDAQYDRLSKLRKALEKGVVFRNSYGNFNFQL